jgi:hypothetical protein
MSGSKSEGGGEERARVTKRAEIQEGPLFLCVLSCLVQKSIEQKLNDWGAFRGRLIVHSNNNRNCVTYRAPGGR